MAAVRTGNSLPETELLGLEPAEAQRAHPCGTLQPKPKASSFLSARNEQEEQEEKREIKRRLTRKVRGFSVPTGLGQEAARPSGVGLAHCLACWR